MTEPIDVSRRFLNVNYAGINTRIDVGGMVDLSQVQDAIKAKYGPAMSDVGAAQIQLFDQQGKEIVDLDYISDEYYEKPIYGGLSLFIRIAGIPTPAMKNGMLLSMNQQVRPCLNNS